MSEAETDPNLEVAAQAETEISLSVGTTGAVAVIGAGIAGLACARRLAGQGIPVRVFDKGRAAGGRIATRRVDALRFDHGAQYFTVRDEGFAALVDGWAAAGIVAPWPAPIMRLAPGAAAQPVASKRRYVGTPGMSAIGRHLAEDLPIQTATRVTGLVRDGDSWRLLGGPEGAAPAALGLADRVVLALPSPQAAELLEPEAPELAAIAAAVPMQACWAVMAAFESPLDLGFGGAFVDGSPIAWIGVEASKPGRSAASALVLHAAVDWSATHLEQAPAAIGPLLIEALAALLGRPLPRTLHLSAHRWRYARPAAPHGRDALQARGRGIALCGDWLRGGRIEDAYLSGLAAGDLLLGGGGDAA